LHVAGSDGATIPHAIAVLHGSGENVGNGFNTSMGMPREAGQIVLGNIIAEVVEQEEGVKILGVAKSECAAQMHASTLDGRLGLNEPLYGSNRHAASSIRNEIVITAITGFSSILSGSLDFNSQRTPEALDPPSKDGYVICRTGVAPSAVFETVGSSARNEQKQLRHAPE
jgi:hypothetical protein